MGATQSLVTGTCSSEDDLPKVSRNSLRDADLGGLFSFLALDQGTCDGEERGCSSCRSASDVKFMGPHMEALLEELFNAHDLNKNGVLEELELVQLNKKIALLHHGKEVDLEEVKEKYQALFRNGLSPYGQPVGFATFRKYVLKVLEDADPDLDSQEMMLEQWLSEARSARLMFHMPSVTSQADVPFLSTISFDTRDIGKHVEPVSQVDFETASTVASMSASSTPATAADSPWTLRQAKAVCRTASFVQPLHAVPPPPPAASDPWSADKKCCV
eukprot:TRINITY_DN18227_c0_g2_i2.p1 TRINITY_DN18227_c0_g2~~TRINITY_DN18227_c0_g2_i2.p1  ORF type:complete len:273 (+),score=59.32 TRINITY_DN18227_c0_g2_i2:53-871(+)